MSTLTEAAKAVAEMKGIPIEKDLIEKLKEETLVVTFKK
jgi:hypothetical protein